MEKIKLKTAHLLRKYGMWGRGTLLFALGWPAGIDAKCYEMVPKPEIVMDSRSFFATTTDTARIAQAEAQLKLPIAQRTKGIVGGIDSGNGGFNGAWNWHLLPGKWEFYQGSMSDCAFSGPQLEKNLAYYLDNGATLCSSGYYLARECAAADLSSDERTSAEGSSGGALIGSAMAGNARGISFWTAMAGRVRLELISIDGRDVILLDARRGAGSHFLEWKSSGLPTGIYHLVMRLEGTVSAVKAVLVD